MQRRHDAEVLAFVRRFGTVTRSQVERACFDGRAARRSAQEVLGRLCREGALRRDWCEGKPAYLPAGERGRGHKTAHAVQVAELWIRLRELVTDWEAEVRVTGGQVDARCRYRGRETWWEVERGVYDRFDLFAHSGRLLCLWTANPLPLPAGVVGAVGGFDREPADILREAMERGTAVGADVGYDPALGGQHPAPLDRRGAVGPLPRDPGPVRHDPAGAGAIVPRGHGAPHGDLRSGALWGFLR